jgi:hypothetical protein
MLRIKRALILFGAAALCGCSYVPSLERTTGAENSPVFIKDVVERVQCELLDGFGDKIDSPEYAWLASWTAKADLTLTLTEAAGITPSVTATKIFPNAPNTAAGPSSLSYNPATGVVSHPPAPFGIGNLAQSFNLGAGATYNESAQRNEVISFSLSLKDVKARAHELNCVGYKRSGLLGQLGLKEWIDSAVHPVQLGLLDAGDHPAPGTAGSARGPSVGTPRATALGKAGDEKCTELRLALGAPEGTKLGDLFKQVENEANILDEKAKTTASDAKTLLNTITTREDSSDIIKVQSKPYDKILNDRYRHGLQQEFRYLKSIESNVKSLYESSILIQASADLLKTQAGKLSSPGSTFDIFKAETLNCSVYNDKIKSRGYGCGWLNCERYLTSTYYSAASTGEKLDERLIKSVLDPDFQACAALDADYKAYNTLFPKEDRKRLANAAANPPVYYDFVTTDQCKAPAIKASTACQQIDERAQLESSCANALDMHQKIKGSGTDIGLEAKLKEIANKIRLQNVKLQLLPAPALPDPPIDSLTHSVNFMVTYGASIAPNWSLASFKGPGANGNLANANRTRTHLLTISMGPRNGGEKATAEQVRNIQNLNILSLRPQ